jgi:putative transposase
MILHRGLRDKLAPAPGQDRLFRRFAGVCRFAYNLARELCSIWWRWLDYRAPCRELTVLWAAFD